jgi:hypothetical protein
MASLNKDLQKLKKSLCDGSIQRAYRGIISYMSRLRRVFADQRGDRAVSGLYQGCFDMTYFALFPDGLKQRDLKVAVVFNYESFNFEAWLAARNRKVQYRYWELLLNSGYKKYRLVRPAVGIDAFVVAILASDYSMEAEDRLTTQIVEGVSAFERNIISFLNKVDPQHSS